MENRARILRFIEQFGIVNGYSPSYREICAGVGISSVTTVSRYVHMLIDENALSINEAKPRTLSSAKISNGEYHDNYGCCIETQHQRLRLDAEDSGAIYVDCIVEKPSNVNIRINITGVLDAKGLRDRVCRIVKCSAVND